MMGSHCDGFDSLVHFGSPFVLQKAILKVVQEYPNIADASKAVGQFRFHAASCCVL